MADPQRLDQLATLLAETGREHHEAFFASNGEDPEWPLWYALHLEGKIESLLGVHLTRSKLVQCLIDAADAHAADGGNQPWPHFYAGYMLALDEDRLRNPDAPPRP